MHRTIYTDARIGISFSKRLTLGQCEDLLGGRVIRRRRLGTQMDQRADQVRFSTLDHWVAQPRRKS
jgi:hypothetical protein